MDAKEIIAQLEQENAELKAQIRDLLAQVERLEEHVYVLLTKD